MSDITESSLETLGLAEVEFSDLEFQEKVGGGGFGTVSKGRWISKNKTPQNLLRMVPSTTTFTKNTRSLLSHRYYSGQYKWLKVRIHGRSKYWQWERPWNEASEVLCYTCVDGSSSVHNQG